MSTSGTSRGPFGNLFRSNRSGSDEADVARENKRGGRTRRQIGLIGIVVTAMVVVVALQMDKLPLISPISTYTAYFDDAGGLVTGDIVTVAGVDVGTVEGIRLASTDAGTKAAVSFRMNDTVSMGSDTQAAIKTETVLGRRNLTILPHGTGRIEPGGEIPNRNTVAPYSLTDALDNATDTLSQTNTAELNKALDTLSVTFSATPDQVQGAVDGVAKLSKAVADRDNALRELLAKASGVTQVIGDRSKQLNQLLLDANMLLGELQFRRAAIAQLISGTRDVAAQISGFINDNNAQLTPVLDKFNKVLDILNDNENNLKETVDRLGPFANALGESVANGPNFDSLVGVSTFGDYTATFMKVLQQKYPEVAQAFSYSGFPLLPNAWSQAPGANPPPRTPVPSPTIPTPPPSTPTTRPGG
ncbi:MULTISPECIES: MCE family protein [unclassified Gordonia (in: high G+C Gram-positive bacteria)]|uniref:MCE family protein n=1 Tax=unclassified Gordonia (in: high G+C Gram-positive bacteria) TaxID=2657482 RepID=UPI0009D0241B|nr:MULTISPECIES: MCE family protein [unclassified Gordonia (in: high G+C Gram-positive bacteria)]MDF3284180.1 MCE family protein [Gordonia sp. N1V]OPX13786.1 virulence factor Mce [Gordonia sp. i37]